MPKSSPTRFTPQRRSPRRYSPVFTSTPRTNGSESPSSSHTLRESRYNDLSYHRNSVESASNQLLEEFSRMMIDKDREFHAALDRASLEQERAHQAALAAAALEHEKVRKAAELARERHELELVKERRRREEEEQRNLERARKEHEEAEHQRKLSKLKQEEEEERRAAQRAKDLADAQIRISAEKDKQAVEDARRKAEKEALDQKTKEAEEKAAREASAKANAPPPASVAPRTAPAARVPAPVQIPTPQPSAQRDPGQSALVTTAAEREAIHKEYLEIHKRLKELRKQVKALGNQNKNIGEARRTLKSRVGQITKEAKANVDIRRRTIDHIEISARDQNGQPQADARQYVTSTSPIASSTTPVMVPALLIYYMHMFGKMVCKQLCTEVGTQSNMAEPIMVQVAFIFSDDRLYANGHSLIDLLLAKFHKACPVLFGIYGAEDTAPGRTRLGWGKLGGAFITETEHRRRIEGLASGYAGLSLRNFARARDRVNPVPNTEFWRAVAVIVNTPTPGITKTHLIVLRNLLEKYAERFIGLYGQMAVVVLRHATTEFPRRATGKWPNEAMEVSLLPDVWKKELRLTLK